MARYFFNLIDESISVADEEGKAFENDERAAEHAAWCAREIMANDVLANRPVNLASCIAVQDERRQELFRLYFRDVIKIDDG